MDTALSRSVLAVCFAVSAAISPAAAATIDITSGTLQVTELGPATFNPSPIAIEGTRGFSLTAIGAEGAFGPALACFYGCDPGQTISLDALWGVQDVLGTATLEGQSYEVGSFSDDASAVVSFHASVLLPTTGADVVTVSVPFTFSGLFSHGLTGTMPVDETLAGRGTVTATFDRALSPGPGFYRPRTTVYTFSSVVPEPGTLTLAGTGLAAVVGAAIRRRRRRRPAVD